MPDSSAGTKEFYFVGSSQVAEEFDRVFHAAVRRMFHVEQLKFSKGAIRSVCILRARTFHVEQFSAKNASPSSNQQSSILRKWNWNWRLPVKTVQSAFSSFY